MDRDTPPTAKKTEHGTVAGNTEGHEPPGTAPPAPCTGTARPARATPTRRGGEACTPREHGRKDTQLTGGSDPKGNRSETAECTHRTEWGRGRRREGSRWRDDPQHAPRGRRGKGGAEGEKQEPAPAPTPQTCCKRRAHTTQALHPPGQ